MRPPWVRVGDFVMIEKNCMAPWGWPEFPKTTEKQIRVPAGTKAIVVDVDVVHQEEFCVTCDYVIGDVLYRTCFESQYVHPVGGKP